MQRVSAEIYESEEVSEELFRQSSARPSMANDPSLGKTDKVESSKMIEPGEMPLAYESRNEALGLATESCLRFGMCCTDYNDLNNILGNPMPVIGKKPSK